MPRRGAQSARVYPQRSAREGRYAGGIRIATPRRPRWETREDQDAGAVAVHRQDPGDRRRGRRVWRAVAGARRCGRRFATAQAVLGPLFLAGGLLHVPDVFGAGPVSAACDVGSFAELTTPLKALTLLWAVGGPVTATGLFAGTFLGDVERHGQEEEHGDRPGDRWVGGSSRPVARAHRRGQYSHHRGPRGAAAVGDGGEEGERLTMSPARVDDEECNNERVQSDSAAVTAWTRGVVSPTTRTNSLFLVDLTFPHPASVIAVRSSSVSSSTDLAHSAPPHANPHATGLPTLPIRAERQRLERVRPPSHPAVEDHGARAVDAGDHLGQRVESGRGPVQSARRGCSPTRRSHEETGRSRRIRVRDDPT